jgi:hypothetical protein
MATRKPITKKIRFEVFKRDSFTCQYCGATPPSATLHIDHINPVSGGGGNHIDNLITACISCNLGKSATPLSSVPKSLKDKAKEVAEREAQISGYNEILTARAGRIEGDAWDVAATLNGVTRVETFNRADFESIKRFIERLPTAEVISAAHSAFAKGLYSSNRRFRYFCGICWAKIREAENGTC